MERNKFQSKVTGTPMIVLILIITILVMVSVLDIYVYGFKYGRILTHLVDLCIIGLIIWILSRTYYIVDDNFVHYFNGPLKGRIAISSITSISKAENKWNILQPGIARKGIRIQTKGNVSFFFAPKDEVAFIAAIKTVNKKVKTD